MSILFSIFYYLLFLILSIHYPVHFFCKFGSNTLVLQCLFLHYLWVELCLCPKSKGLIEVIAIDAYEYDLVWKQGIKDVIKLR